MGRLMTYDEDKLRSLLTSTATAIGADDTRAARAIATGRRREHRRRLAAAGGSMCVVAALTVVATFWLSAGPAAAPAMAGVTCSRDRTLLSSDTVVAGAGGATLQVDNETGGAVQLVADQTSAFLPPGQTAVVLPLAPGRHQLSCEGSRATVPATLDVVDDGHIYTRAALPCAHPVLRDFSAASGVRTGDPVDLTAQLFHAPSNAVSVLGYPAATARTIALLRRDRVVRTATWHQLVSEHVWTLGVVQECPPS